MVREYSTAWSYIDRSIARRRHRLASAHVAATAWPQLMQWHCSDFASAILFTCLALARLVSDETTLARICYKIKIAKAYYCLKLNGIMTSIFFHGQRTDREQTEDRRTGYTVVIEAGARGPA